MESTNNPLQEYRFIPHYHGDKVRILFIIAGIIMILGLPFFQELIHLPLYSSFLGILALGFIAGLTNPRQMWVALLDTCISIAALVIFEYYAIHSFNQESLIFFWTNQILALLFFAALYFSTKTLRGFFFRKPK
ncbi:hypothetical protein HYS91_01290 [Candidatus Daviesbacteria bacterium]|nr:hypothetical protein [Candidatus Daviesbacteria bacterium]